jgi:hypothetical protein
MPQTAAATDRLVSKDARGGIQELERLDVLTLHWVEAGSLILIPPSPAMIDARILAPASNGSRPRPQGRLRAAPQDLTAGTRELDKFSPDDR